MRASHIVLALVLAGLAAPAPANAGGEHDTLNSGFGNDWMRPGDGIAGLAAPTAAPSADTQRRRLGTVTFTAQVGTLNDAPGRSPAPMLTPLDAPAGTGPQLMLSSGTGTPIRSPFKVLFASQTTSQTSAPSVSELVVTKLSDDASANFMPSQNGRPPESLSLTPLDAPGGPTIPSSKPKEIVVVGSKLPSPSVDTINADGHYIVTSVEHPARVRRPVTTLAHDVDRPFDVPSGPGSVRAMPTMTPAGEAPCCTNNLKQIGLGIHNYNDAPGAGALASPVAPPATGPGYVLTTPVHAARTPPVSPVVTYSITNAWPKGGVERRLATPQKLPTSPATPAGPQR